MTLNQNTVCYTYGDYSCTFTLICCRTVHLYMHPFCFLLGCFLFGLGFFLYSSKQETLCFLLTKGQSTCWVTSTRKRRHFPHYFSLLN
ncbi:mediator complex subunit 9 [Columba livia]|uniref:Mediator complex subunit 9 n=1 Tax=Columba livia TaxID=8932 RepID=A0A2I0M0U6_COLLI|nr:mediator complex subunit 9 [Columba livia]